MIDIKLIRDDPDAIRELCRRRKCDVDIDRLLELDRELREATASLNELQHERNVLKGQDDREKTRELKKLISESKQKVGAVKEERDVLWAAVPNLLADDTPEGTGDHDNVEIFRWGKIPEPDFKTLSHEELCANLDILDLRRGANVAGTGFYYWKGLGAHLNWAIFSMAIDFLRERGFTFMFTPVLAKGQTLFGTGYLPFSKDEIYTLENEDLSLIGTSEQTLVGYHMDEVLPEKELPLLYTAFSPCFRTEAGAYGKKSRGAFRVHQFHKVEQIVFCHPDESEKWHKECQRNIEDFMKLLDIPYRVVRVCIGDLGAPGYSKLDTEAWFTGFATYRETHSNTNLLDYQTRRLNTRCRSGKLTYHPHTISATMITDRAALAIIENNQNRDGSIKVPHALQNALGGADVIGRNHRS